MSMGASITVVNNTGSTIMFTSVTKVNDDPTFSGISKGQKLAAAASATLSMANSSAFPFVRGVGANIQFTNSNFDMGGITLDDPAVGAHSFSYLNGAEFTYHTTNPNGNSYTVVVGLA